MNTYTFTESQWRAMYNGNSLSASKFLAACNEADRSRGESHMTTKLVSELQDEKYVLVQETNKMNAQHKKGQRRWYVTRHVETGKRHISFWDNPPQLEDDPEGEFVWSHPFTSEGRARVWSALNPDKP